MGQNTDDIERPREYDFKAGSKRLLEKFQKITDGLCDKAIELIESGEDIRSNDQRPGIGTLLHAAGQSMNEVQRLSNLVGITNTATSDFENFVDGVNFMPSKYAQTSNNN